MQQKLQETKIMNVQTINFQCCRITNPNHEVKTNINNSPLKMKTTNEPNGPYTTEFIIS